MYFDLMIMLFNSMLVLGFASQVCALPPPSTPPSPARKMSTRLSSMFKPKPGDVQQLEISIHYEVIGTQKLPKVDSVAQKLVKAASRRLNLPTNTKFTFRHLNEASSATGPIRFTFWGPEACESSATEGAEAESSRRVQTRGTAEPFQASTPVLRKRDCEVFIEDISKNELDVLMWNATHDVVYVSKHGADLPFSPPIFADDNSVLLFFVERPTNENAQSSRFDAAAVSSTTNSILDKFNNLATLATIPSSCNDTCNTIEATISDCTTVQCVCTSPNEAALNTCVDCLEAVKPNQTVISQAQDILNQYAALCDAGGISVPVQTASGFSGSVGLPLSTPSVGSVTQSTPAGTETATSPGLSQTGLQSTVFASSVSASSLSSLTSLASSVSASGTSSTTASASSASKAALDQGSFALVGCSELFTGLGLCSGQVPYPRIEVLRFPEIAKLKDKQAAHATRGRRLREAIRRVICCNSPGKEAIEGYRGAAQRTYRNYPHQSSPLLTPAEVLATTLSSSTAWQQGTQEDSGGLEIASAESPHIELRR
ncbi:hypothetical protein EV368DRAFT_64060 [Lentinula lateritia]|nr:hypothetical protein EV368DRAFT_64060 [Lentinula lateritia]